MDAQVIKAVIFDLGGVLLDWNPRYLYRHHFDKPEQMEEFLSEIDFASWNAQQDKGRRFVEGVAELSSRYPHRQALIRAYHENWERSVAGPIADTVVIVRGLKAAGHPIFGLTNWSAETFPIAYNKYDFLKLFDSIVVSGEVHLLKPDPRIFELTLRRIGFAAAHCLLVDDSAQNIAVAASLGFPTIHFRSSQELETRLLELQLLHPSWRETIAQ